ncbi:YolD-like family protein [Ornithinibacillus massiliensis]|uniref:YolD-like family protein n=1 Tax=Ornithinibacillus massiliensis TaxID=1944633 RepID=A0ABS5MDE4_9BACI|nr:YolD-like family protein [Ornithinibacillus massiliensis]
MNDRGSIKWTSLMLPEHVELLKSIWSEDKRIQRPLLDEQELELINNQIIEAYQDNQLITLTYYQSGKMLAISGTIQKFDQLKQKVLLKNLNEEILAIPFNDIYRIQS